MLLRGDDWPGRKTAATKAEREIADGQENKFGVRERQRQQARKQLAEQS
jgi:hypothetical protein